MCQSRGRNTKLYVRRLILPAIITSCSNFLFLFRSVYASVRFILTFLCIAFSLQTWYLFTSCMTRLCPIHLPAGACLIDRSVGQLLSVVKL